MEEQLLSQQEAAKVLGVTRVTLWRWLRDGQIKASVRVNGKVPHFRRQDLDEYLERHAKGANVA